MAGMSQAAHRLRVPDSVAESLRRMHPDLKRKIKSSFKIIVADPYQGKALKDELAGMRSLRVSRFRIIYRLREHLIEVVAVGPRERIYEETAFLLRKAETI